MASSISSIAHIHRGMAHDPERFEDPDKFRPERFYDPAHGRDASFLEESKKQVRSIVFGFGRRYVRVSSCLIFFRILRPSLRQQGMSRKVPRGRLALAHVGVGAGDDEDRLSGQCSRQAARVYPGGYNVSCTRRWDVSCRCY